MCEQCEWEIWLSEIKSMQSEGVFDFAARDMRRLRDELESDRHISEKQIKKIQRILKTQQEDSIA